MSTRFIFVDPEAEMLHVSPGFDEDQICRSTENNAAAPLNHLPQALADIFQVHNVEAFHKACQDALTYGSAALDDASAAKSIAPVEELPLKDMRMPQADQYIFVLSGQLFFAPVNWDGKLTSLYEHVNDTVQIAQAVNTARNRGASGSLTYNYVLKVPSAALSVIDGYLNAGTADEFQSENCTISYTVRFPDGREMDIKCCGCQDDSSWTEAVLFDMHGNELACTEVCDTFVDLWELEYGGVTYAVNVIAADDEYTSSARFDEEGICPVCGATLEEYGAQETLDEGGVIPWECSQCGATGKEGYDRVFDRHYNVCFANGNPVPDRDG